MKISLKKHLLASWLLWKWRASWILPWFHCAQFFFTSSALTANWWAEGEGVPQHLLVFLLICVSNYTNELIKVDLRIFPAKISTLTLKFFTGFKKNKLEHTVVDKGIDTVCVQFRAHLMIRTSKKPACMTELYTKITHFEKIACKIMTV